MLFKKRQRIHVGLVEDERGVASAWGELLQLEFEVLFVALNAASGRAACLKHVPDVVLVDWILPDGDGVELIHTLAPMIPNARWLLVSACTYADMVLAAESAGAAGIIDKSRNDFEAVRQAVRALSKGGCFFCPVSSDFIRRALPAIHPPLSDQEKRILKALARYRSCADIARSEKLDRSTIHEHVTRIARKLSLDDRPGVERLVSAARDAGALPRLPKPPG